MTSRLPLAFLCVPILALTTSLASAATYSETTDFADIYPTTDTAGLSGTPTSLGSLNLNANTISGQSLYDTNGVSTDYDAFSFTLLPGQTIGSTTFTFSLENNSSDSNGQFVWGAYKYNAGNGQWNVIDGGGHLSTIISGSHDMFANPTVPISSGQYAVALYSGANSGSYENYSLAINVVPAPLPATALLPLPIVGLVFIARRVRKRKAD